MRRTIAAALAGVFMLPQLATGQGLVPGSRVRISLPDDGARTGTVVALTADTLEVRLQGQAASARLSLGQLTRLEISRGSQRHPEYAGKGALVGFALGAVGGFAAGSDDCSQQWVCINRPGGALLGGGVFGAAGGLFGLIAGVIPSETWERVSLDTRRVSLVARPGGRGSGVGLRLAF